MNNNHFSILKKINSPEDLKSLNEKELSLLCSQLRDFIIQHVRESGGHLASNLGTVELTVALHSVFDSPRDKIIWDVGHQSYAHKILTGRRELFKTIRQLGGISGFPKHTESEHDILDTGHASTSISAGLGIKIGEELKGTENKVIVVIGDGALTGGLALEGLNNTGHLRKNLIVILNDNGMSISSNVGAIASNLGKLKATKAYINFRSWYDSTVESLPIVGKPLLSVTKRTKQALKAYLHYQNIFTVLGFDYFGPIDGHNVKELIHVLNNIKDLKTPVLLHVTTVKGKGFKPAEINPTKFHGLSPDWSHSVSDSEDKVTEPFTWSRAFGEYMVTKAKDNPRVVAITAAMSDGTGLKVFSETFPKRFFDVGIAEEHAFTFAAGLAISGQRPVVAVYSTFAQRAVDQIIHDIAIPHLPVVIALDRAGIVPGDGETHQGVYDIPIFKSVPGITITAPACREEMELLLDYAFTLKGPFIIRYPKDYCPEHIKGCEEGITEGRGIFVRKEKAPVLMIGVGSTTIEMLKAADILYGEGFSADVYNLRFIKPLDTKYFLDIVSPYKYIFISEEGSLEGGIGEKVSSLILSHFRNKVIKTFGVPDRFISHGPRGKLLSMCGLDAQGMAERIVEVLESKSDRKAGSNIRE